MKDYNIDKELFKTNRKKLLKHIRENSLVVLHANDLVPRNGDQFYSFRQYSDFFYLTGINQEKCILALCPDHPDEKSKEILFIEKTDKQREIWDGPKYSKEMAQDISGIGNVQWLDNFGGTFSGMVSTCENIYLDLNEKLSFSSDFVSPNRKLIQDIQSKYPLHNYFRLAPILEELRLIKEPEEIRIIKHACQLTEKAFFRLLQFVKPGIMEYEAEAEMIHEFIRNGGDGHAFKPIVASGENACILHYIQNNKKCEDGELLLLDFGAEYANYASDCSRTIPVNGVFTQRQRELYEAVLSVYKRAKKLILPGSTINEINKKVNKWWELKHVEIGLYTKEDLAGQKDGESLVKKYFPHGNSHFMGLDVHDVGRKDTELKPGMILTCEPGIYIPEEKTGIRIETDVLVTEDEPLDLMSNIPVDPDEIEKLMRS